MYVSESTKLMGERTVREGPGLEFEGEVKGGPRTEKKNIIEARNRQQFNDMVMNGHMELRTYREGGNLGCSMGEADYANIRILQ